MNSDEIRLADDRRAIDAGGSAGLEFLASIQVARDDPVQLVLRGAEVIADQFAEDRPVIISPPQVSAAGAKHRPGLAGDPGHGVIRVTPKNAAAVSFVET